MRCPYCASADLETAYRGEFHKVDRSFGPFDLGACGRCGSLATVNPPSPDRLAEFYRRYDQFRPDWYKAGAAAGALRAQYEFYARHVGADLAAGRTWIDIGAGHGEVSNLLAERHPDCAGTAIDIGERPSSLRAETGYESIDLNRPGWLDMLGRRFDRVFAVAVWEHVLDPGQFAREALSLVAPRGRLILICPDYGSLARRILGRRWPYFEPGEHISIPTREGARRCLEAACADLGLDGAVVRAKPLNVGYSLGYLSSVLRLRPLAALIPPGWSAPLPTGILSATIQRR